MLKWMEVMLSTPNPRGKAYIVWQSGMQEMRAICLEVSAAVGRFGPWTGMQRMEAMPSDLDGSVLKEDVIEPAEELRTWYDVWENIGLHLSTLAQDDTSLRKIRRRRKDVVAAVKRKVKAMGEWESEKHSLAETSESAAKRVKTGPPQAKSLWSSVPTS